MKLTHYSKLIEVINKKYNNIKGIKEGDKYYFNAINEVNKIKNWNDSNLEDLSKSIGNFLFWWNTPYSRMYTLNINDLQNTIKEISHLLQSLKNQKIENFSSKEDVAETVKNIFNKLSSLNGVKFTGATKVMTILNPNLFIMWDREIRDKNGCNCTAEGYINFLLKMQKEAEEIINTFCKEKHISGIEKAKEEICKICHTDKRSLTKLIDEYNYALKKRFEC